MDYLIRHVELDIQSAKGAPEFAENYWQHNESWYNPRQFRMGLTWRFGKTNINLKRAQKTEVSDKL